MGCCCSSEEIKEPLLKEQRSSLKTPNKSSILKYDHNEIGSFKLKSSPKINTNTKKTSILEERYSKSLAQDKDIKFDPSSTELDLSGRNLVMIPSALKECKKVVRVDISYNTIYSLPVWFQGLNTLREVDLSNNNFFEVPNIIVNLTALEKINLEANKFEYFPSTLLKMKNIKYLNLKKNFMANIPSDIKNMSGLETLLISENMLIKLPPQIAEMGKLKTLSIYGNKFIHSTSAIEKKLKQKKIKLISETDEEEIKVNKVSGEKTVRLNSQKSTYFGKRVLAVKELLESEKKYSNYMKILYHSFYLELKKREILDLEILNQIFPTDLEAIYNFSIELLKELEICINMENEKSIYDSLFADILIERAPFLKIYTQYISKYPTSYRVYEEYLEKSSKFASFLEDVSSKNENLTLSAYLIMPIQRIPRYKMLISSVLEYTDTDHDDYIRISEALKKLEQSAKYVDEKLLELSNRDRVITLRKELSIKDLVQPHRTVIKEGKLENDKKKHVHLYIFNDLLVIQQKGMVNNIQQFDKSQIEVKIIDENSFELILNKKGMVLNGGKVWTDPLQKII